MPVRVRRFKRWLWRKAGREIRRQGLRRRRKGARPASVAAAAAALTGSREVTAPQGQREAAADAEPFPRQRGAGLVPSGCPPFGGPGAAAAKAPDSPSGHCRPRLLESLRSAISPLPPPHLMVRAKDGEEAAQVSGGSASPAAPAGSLRGELGPALPATLACHRRRSSPLSSPPVASSPAPGRSPAFVTARRSTRAWLPSSAALA